MIKSVDGERRRRPHDDVCSSPSPCVSIHTFQETHTTAMNEVNKALQEHLRVEKQAHEAVHGLFTSTHWLFLNGKTGNVITPLSFL